MSKFLKQFTDHADYEEYIEGSPTYPNVSECLNQEDVHYNDPPNPWRYDVAIMKSADLKDYPNAVTSPDIEVQPSKALTITGERFGSDIAICLKQDKTYTDYWTNNGATLIGSNIYKRTVTLNSSTYYVRISAMKENYHYLKLEQNGVVLFDGSLYPPRNL